LTKLAIETIFVSQHRLFTVLTLDNQHHLSVQVNCAKIGWKLFQVFHRTCSGRERKP